MAFTPKTDAEQKVIVAQNAATAAATIYASLGFKDWDPAVYEDIRRAVFKGTLELTLAEVVVQGADGVERAVNFEPAARTSGGGGGPRSVGGGPSADGDPGAFTLGFGKYNGKTVAEVYATDPAYVTEYLVEKVQHNQTKNAVRKFVAGLAQAA